VVEDAADDFCVRMAMLILFPWLWEKSERATLKKNRTKNEVVPLIASTIFQ
jgi:hypothetical protein